jgi:hypothetical protein
MHMNIYIYIYKYVYRSICIYTHILTNIHIDIYICIHRGEEAIKSALKIDIIYAKEVCKLLCGQGYYENALIGAKTGIYMYIYIHIYPLILTF